MYKIGDKVTLNNWGIPEQWNRVGRVDLSLYPFFEIGKEYIISLLLEQYESIKLEEDPNKWCIPLSCFGELIPTIKNEYSVF